MSKSRKAAIKQLESALREMGADEEAARKMAADPESVLLAIKALAAEDSPLPATPSLSALAATKRLGHALKQTEPSDPVGTLTADEVREVLGPVADALGELDDDLITQPSVRRELASFLRALSVAADTDEQTTARLNAAVDALEELGPHADKSAADDRDPFGVRSRTATKSSEAARRDPMGRRLGASDR